MSLSIPTVNNIPQMEKGNYPARVVQVIDLGIQHEEDFKSGKPLYYNEKGEKVTEESHRPVLQPKVWINFEFPTETINIDGEEKPRWQGREYVISGSPKSNMYALLEAAGVDTESVSDLIGKALTVEIGHTSSDKAKVKSVSPIMKGVVVPGLINTPVVFDLDNFDLEVYNSLPGFLRDKIDNRIQL